MNKQEIQQRVSQFGKPLPLDKFEWDEKTNTFSTTESNLVLDFKGISYCIFETGSSCTFNTGSSCIFETGSFCTFKTRSSCTFITGSSCTFKTGSSCIFNTGSFCTFEIGSSCTFKTGSFCTFNRGSSCIFDTRDYCTFDTGGSCTFDTGKECVVVRRDVYEIIELVAGQKIKLNDFGIKGYTIFCETTLETIEIGGIKYSKKEVEEKLKGIVAIN